MADIIQQYLISLGYQIDDVSFAKFRDGIGRSTVAVADFGIKAAGAATAVAAMVATISEKYEDLYFTSIKAGASSVHLQQFAYGSNQIGISTEQAAGSLERFNLALLGNPGRQFLLNYLGVQTVGRDTKKIYDDLIDTLARMQPYMAFMYGAQFGLSPEEINQRIILRRQEAEAEADYSRRLQESGINLDDLTSKSHDFQVEVRRLESEIGIIGVQITDKWVGPLTEAVKYAEQWAEWAAKGGKATQGWTSTILALTGALAGIKGLAWILRLLGISTGAIGIDATLTALGYSALVASLPYAAMAVPATVFYPTTANRGEKDIYDKQGNLTEYGRQLKQSMGGQLPSGTADQTHFAPNTIPGQSAMAQVSVTTPSGKSFQVSKQYAPYFQWFADMYEKSGGNINAIGGYSATGHIPGSKHHWGGAVDVNEYGAGGRRTAGALPEATENQLAMMAGLYPGSQFASNYDPGHFEVSKELEEWVAAGKSFADWKKAHTVPNIWQQYDAAKLTDPGPHYDETRLSPSVARSSKIAITQNNSVTAKGTIGPERDPVNYNDRFNNWSNSSVRQTKPIIH